MWTPRTKQLRYQHETMSEYLLGTSDHELERLGLQHGIFGDITAQVLDAARIGPGMRVLDAGSGPGFVTADLRERVGAEGRVVALEESERWVEHLREHAARQGWQNVELRLGKLEHAELAREAFDVVFLRWVLSFLPDPEGVLRRLAAGLRPGGRCVVMDYNHEGISAYPDSPGFRAAVRACREAYAERGGDTRIMLRMRALFRGAGLVPEPMQPFVIAGGPGSPVHRWLDTFFPFHATQWAESGLLSAAEHSQFLSEWRGLAENPDATFFSPIIVGASARKPS